MRKIIILALFLLIFPAFAEAQTACPIGLANDPAPGSCGSFIDGNGNNLCDLSEIPVGDISSVYSEPGSDTEYISGEELKKYTIQQIAALYNVSAQAYAEKLAKAINQKVALTDSLQVLHDTYGLCAGVAGSIAIDLKNKNNLSVQPQIAKTETDAMPKGKKIYDIIPITFVLLVLYYFTWSLVKMKKITLLCHRRIWNVLLLVTFLISGILGILLVIRINYGWTLNLPFNMLYWHVEAGIAMAIITFFHIAWHWQYYICMFKQNKDKCKTDE